MKLQTIGRKLRPPAQVKVRVPEKRARPFYSSPEWRALLEAIIERRGRRCEDLQHDTYQPRSGRRIYGDHIRELNDHGAPLDPRNVMLRCASCHTRKTAETRGDRYHGGGQALSKSVFVCTSAVLAWARNFGWRQGLKRDAAIKQIKPQKQTWRQTSWRRTQTPDLHQPDLTERPGSTNPHR